jgi:hypothetical protein
MDNEMQYYLHHIIPVNVFQKQATHEDVLLQTNPCCMDDAST